MASCRQDSYKVEQTVLQPLSTWARQGRQQCSQAACIWWLLCLNKLVCAIFWFLVEVIVWIMTVIVRVFYTLVCPIFKIIAAILTLGTVVTLTEAFSDLWEGIKFIVYSAIGLVVAIALNLVSIVQTALGIQKSRPLTETERGILARIYFEALALDAIRIVTNAGILSGANGREYTIGFNIFSFPGGISADTLVHESVHVWQFQHQGTKYIGQSLLLQLDEKLSPGYNMYDWNAVIPPGPDGWYLIKSAEAQAKFVEDLFVNGAAVDGAGAVYPKPGAFFHEDPGGTNSFITTRGDFTARANAAWRVLRT